jgi:hypothetical protein
LIKKTISSEVSLICERPKRIKGSQNLITKASRYHTPQSIDVPSAIIKTLEVAAGHLRCLLNKRWKGLGRIRIS